MLSCRKCARELPPDALFCCYCGVRLAPVKPKRRKRSNGSGTVFRYRGAWAIELTDGWIPSADGQLRRKSIRRTGFKTVTEAENALAELRTAAPEAPAERKIITMTVADLWASYAASELPKRGSSTQTAYKIAWRRRISGAIGDRPIDTVTLEDLNALVANCTYDPAKDVRDLMSILFQRAIVDRQTTVNPAKLMTMPEQSGKEVVPWLPEEISSLWRAWGDGVRTAGYCLLMIYSGMMTGELLRLQESMIHWDDQQIIGCGLKTKKRREMPIHFPAIIEPILRELCATKSGPRGCDGYILDTSERVFYDRFRKMKLDLGIRPEVIPYSSRHTTGTELSSMGVPPAIIIDIMRHKNYTTTLHHYTKIPSDVLVATLNRMAENDSNAVSNSCQ